MKNLLTTAAQSINPVIEKSGNSHRAFTLIELLVVIGILGILVAALVATFSGSTESARSAKCLANMRNLAMAVQSVGMATRYYPFAGTFKRNSANRNSSGKRDAATLVQGWIGSESTTYISPYTSGNDAFEKSIELGSIWASMNGARDCYFCPCHQQYAKQHQKVSPLWSYAMNSHFGWAGQSGRAKISSYTGRYYTSFGRADRYLLFAELPYAETTVAGQKIQDGSISGSQLDPVLDHDTELVGFNHTSGKNVTGHVCFADGHVEKLIAPKSGSIQDLTKWLCVPHDDSGDFDVSFDGNKYEKVQK